MINKTLLTTLSMIGLSLSAHAQELLSEHVLVTATRIQVDASDLALNWSAVSEDELDLTGLIHINEIMQRVPGAWISRGNGQESLTALRSPVLTGSGSCGAFFMAADGISLRAPGFCNVNQLFDANSEQAARIEVIKGPATSLYGSNAMHGVINVLSKAPTETSSNSLAVEAGPFDYYRAKYSHGNTVGKHGISIALNGTSDGGYKDDSGYDQQKATLRHDYEGDLWQIVSALDVTNLNQETAGFIRGYEAYKDSDLKKSNPNPEAYRDARSLRLYSSASRQLDDWNLLTITPYYRDNKMEFLQHFLPWQPVEKNGHRSAGIRGSIHTDAGAWHWVNGIDLEYTDGWLEEVQENEFSPNQPTGVHYDYQVDATVAAAYSQLNLDLSDRLSVMAGARAEYTHYDYDNRTDDGSACAPSATACRFYRPADRQDSFNNWSFNAGVSYSLSDNHSSYLRLAQGFRAPQTTELYRLQSGQRVADLDSEELGNIELGLRGNFSDKLQYDISVYLMNKDEVIFQDADRQNVSGAKTEHYGSELSLDYFIADAWELGLDLTLARHKYDSRIELLGANTNIKGNDIDTAPRTFGSARLGWNLQPDFNWDAKAELEWVYMSSYYLEPDNAHKYSGHSLVNLRVSSAVTEHLTANLRLTNLLDEDYAERADFGFGQYRYFVGQPMGAYVELVLAWP